MRNHIPLLTICFLFLLGCHLHPSQKKGKDKRQRPKNSVSTKRKNNQFSLTNIFVSKQKRMALKCPTGSNKTNSRKGRITTNENNRNENGVSMQRRFRSIQFDIIELEEYKLDIPAFKQFLNNHTDFTENGEEQFKLIIQEIRNYLGKGNTTGKGVTLKIIGSASQIPTSFDPSKPNNNIRANGSSIPGKTSIENNKKLAQARALELAKKIKIVFKNIEIETPTLQEIKLGKTKWDSNTQRALNDAHLRKNENEKKLVYEPFQKDQYVKVESKESKKRTIKPNAIKMYVAYAVPRMIYYKNNDSIEVGRFIISENTYKTLEKNSLRFKNAEAREKFLKNKNLEIYLEKKGNGEKRWYLLHGHNEKHAFHIHNPKDDDKKRLYQLYQLGIVNDQDKVLLEEVITERYLKKHRELRDKPISIEEKE